MEGTSGEHEQAHELYQVEGVHYAWKQAGDQVSGELTWGRTAEELAAKLDG